MESIKKNTTISCELIDNGKVIPMSTEVVSALHSITKDSVEIDLQSSSEYIVPGQVVEYTVTIKNVGKELKKILARVVVDTIDEADGSKITFIEDSVKVIKGDNFEVNPLFTISIEKLDLNEEVAFSFLGKIGEDAGFTSEIRLEGQGLEEEEIIEIEASDKLLQKYFRPLKVKTMVVDVEDKEYEKAVNIKNYKFLQGYIFKYVITVENENDEGVKNIVLKEDLPLSVTIHGRDILIEDITSNNHISMELPYNLTSNIFSINLNSMYKKQVVRVVIPFTINY